MAAASVSSLWHYPVKGLSAQPLERAAVRAGAGFAGDREWALARADGLYRRGAAGATPKHEFHVLVADERLAGVRSEVLPPGRLRLFVQEHEVLAADLHDPRGREMVSRFFARMLGVGPERAPVIAHEPGRRFTDVAVVSDALMQAVSLINLASVRALEERVERPIDPLRFRANIYVDGLPAFAERDLLGAGLRIGEVPFRVALGTRRCAATEVDPATARRDLPIPRLLMEHFGIDEMGVYLTAEGDGTLGVGDPVTADGASYA